MESWAKEHNISSSSPEYAYQFIVQAKPHTFFNLIFKPALGILFLDILILIIYGMFVSKKIAGPIYRLKRTLADRIEGKEVYAITYRKGDPFRELSLLANQALNLKEKPKQE